MVPVPIHGGSLRRVLRHGQEPHCQAAMDLAERERRDGFFGPDKYAQAPERKRIALRRLLADGSAVGYGAAAKANTLLNFCGLDLRYIVDDNPLKWGYLTPGRNIPIVEPDRFASESRNVLELLLAWTFKNEVQNRLQQLRPRCRTKLVRYVPDPCVEQVRLG